MKECKQVSQSSPSITAQDQLGGSRHCRSEYIIGPLVLTSCRIQRLYGGIGGGWDGLNINSSEQLNSEAERMLHLPQFRHLRAALIYIGLLSAMRSDSASF